MLANSFQLQNNDALLVVDVQNDFCPYGALPVPNGDKVVPVLNNWIKKALTQNLPIYFSRDFHPLKHPSFQSEGGRWPIHCLQDSKGARFHSDLIVPDNAIIVTKGVRFDQDQNSAFDQTGLFYQMQREGINRLCIGGLALEVCVLATALDSIRFNLDTYVLLEGSCAITDQGAQEALNQMHAAGVNLIGDKK